MDDRAHLLIVDDEAEIASMLDEFFRMEGYRTTVAMSGEQAVRAVEASTAPGTAGIDLILLDASMPGMDGFEACRRIRKHASCPIVFLTARIEDADQLDGFASGADDYVTKPFSLPVLASRVRAHLARAARHEGGAPASVRRFPGIAVDFAQRTVEVTASGAAAAPGEGAAADDGLGCGEEAVPGGASGGAPAAPAATPSSPTLLDLTRTEFDIVALLCRAPGRVYDRDVIYEQVWGWNACGDPSIVREHVRRIRRKIAEAGGDAGAIETVWGVGYKWGLR